MPDLRFWRWRQAQDDDLDRELDLHLDLEAEEHAGTGLPDREAKLAAHRAFGSVALAKEEVREMRTGAILDQLWRDVRHAMRLMGRSPAFTIVAVLTLALGIGANTAIFSVVYGVVLRPLGYRDPDRLVSIHEVIPRFIRTQPLIPVNVGHFLEWRRSTRSFDGMSVLGGQQMNLTGLGEPEPVIVARASSNIFGVLGVEPRLGRTFFDEEDQRGRDHVVVLSDALWRRRFAADSAIIGRPVTLDDEQYEVVGVLPAAFHFPKLQQLYGMTVDAGQPQIWKPFAATDAEIDPGNMFNFICIARLAAGVSMSQAASELNITQRAITERLPVRQGQELGGALVPLRNQITGRSRVGLELVLGAVGAMLLIGCVNLTNLLCARTTARRPEIALRSALGASRGRLIQQLLVESVAISGAGGLLGLLLASRAVPLILAAAPADLPRLDDVHLDERVLLFTLVVSVSTGLVLGILPVWRFTRVDPQEALQRGSTRAAGVAVTGRLRSLLIGLEVSLSVICLLAGGLLLHSFTNLLGRDPGFDVQRVITVDMNLPTNRYQTTNARAAFVRSVLSGIQSLPGVVSAGMSNKLPLSGEGGSGVIIVEGVEVPNSERPAGNQRMVNPDYFRTLGVPILSGRVFEESDRDRQVAVISALAADRLWPGMNPIGKRFRTGPLTAPFKEVIGIVGDVRGASLEKSPVLTVYQPYWQSMFPPVSFALRTTGDPRAVSSGIRGVIHRIDAEIPLQTMRTMDDVIAASLAERRFQLGLVLLFALTATVLASLGIYGVVSYSVAQRTSEIGVRMALGAQPRQIRALVIAESLLPVAAGLVIG
ncbi:MAG TPA: ABC transporter permease, partial [Vicinamibacterales bacterium]|nr:ABC transporter permease [Vicinamibacterales bacterium]